MIVRFLRLFHVMPDEGAKLALFAAFGALLQGGIAIGMTATDSLFLTHLGPEKLPFFFLFMPVVMAVYAPTYAALLGRFGIERLVTGTLLVLVAGGIFFGLGASLFGEANPVLLYSMKFYVGLWFIGLYTLFWNFIDDYFSILDSKRLYGIIAAGVGVGSILGAGFVSVFSHFVAPGRLFFAWAVVAAVTLPMFGWLRRRFRKLDVEEETDEQPESALGSIRGALGTLRGSRFALALAALAFCAANGASLLEYLSMGVFSPGKSPAELARLLGQLFVVANVLTLLVNLFGYNRLVGRLGIGNTALIVPLVFLTAFAGCFLHYGFIAALIAFYAYQTLLPGLEYNNVNVLFTALPAAAKKQLRTFVESLTEPCATALAGGFLLAFGAWVGTAVIALVGMGVALVALTMAFVLRHHYGTALANNLRRDWLDFSPSPEYWQKQLTHADRALLREKALCSPERAERIAATDLLGFASDSESSNAITQLVATARPSEAELLRPAIGRILRSDDTATIAELLLWLESEHSPEDPELLDEFTGNGAVSVRQLPHWTRSRHPARIAMSAIARWHGPRLDEVGRALADVQALLKGDSSIRRWGVRALGGFRHPQFARELLALLAEQDGELRIEVLRALYKLASPETESVLPRVLPLLVDASADERKLILGIAEKIGSIGPLADLLLSARLFPAAENRQLETMVVSFGPRAIATVMDVLRSPTASSRSRILAARALCRMSRPQLDLISGELMSTELRRAWDAAAAASALGTSSTHEQDSTIGNPEGIAVLRRFYHDNAVEGLDFAVQLLGLTGRLQDVDLIRASLTSANPRDRANAIEAIGQSCPHALYVQFERLFSVCAENNGPENRPGAHSASGSAPPQAEVLRRAATSDNALECAAAVLSFAKTEHSRARDLVQRRIAVTQSADETATFAALLPFLEANPGRGRVGLNPVERVAVFVSAPYFDGARIAALEYLASRCTERLVPAGMTLYSPHQPTGNLMVIAEGAMDVTLGGVTRRLERGGTCNERSLMGMITSDEVAVSCGATVLQIPSTTVARAIEIFPALGISLYRTKTVEGAGQ